MFSTNGAGPSSGNEYGGELRRGRSQLQYFAAPEHSINANPYEDIIQQPDSRDSNVVSR